MFPNDFAQDSGVFDDFLLGHGWEHVVEGLVAKDFEAVATTETGVDLNVAVLPAKSVSLVLSELSFCYLWGFH